MSSDKLSKQKIEEIKEQAIKEVSESNNLDTLDSIRVKFVGRKGDLTNLLGKLKDLSLEEKREIGPLANKAKSEIEEEIENKKKSLESDKSKAGIDLTKPGKKIKRGHYHPLTIVGDEVVDVFRSLNFSVVDGPEIESEFYNFDALNIPQDHPARDMWDTFWIKDEKSKEGEKSLLRTHTSPVQIRYMKENKPPFQIIVPGRVFRYEATDASHEINFYQVEGLMVGKNINLSNLKYIVEEFLKKIFDDSIEFRFRPSYFPFVEPGLEVDIKMKNGKDEWLEILGAGMVHPNVFKAAGYKDEDVQGFAFGVGLDRIAMIKYDIPDIRLLYSGDLRFIKQF